MSSISACRLCQSEALTPVFSLGYLAFSGIFPSPNDPPVPLGQLSIVLCGGCKLAQLDRDFPGQVMYGDNYGYMSSLNSSMVTHLNQIVQSLEQVAGLKSGDVVLDIGSNDGTMLSLYSTPGLVRVGMDPTISKYKKLYPSDVITVADFFSAASFDLACKGQKAKVVSTVAMLYDLPDPLGFAKDVRKIMADSGFWLIEVSYGPWMLESGSFDAVCHEHVEYYSLFTLKKILDHAGFKIASVSFNQTNGGSISITATPTENSEVSEAYEGVVSILNEESKAKYNTADSWVSFNSITKKRIADLEKFLLSTKDSGKRVVALGASTKGNVLLQSLSPEAQSVIEVIGEVNAFKFGKLTPGTRIGILPEAEVIASKPDYILVLPWHFKESFQQRLGDFLAQGGQVVYPLPQLEVIGAGNVYSP